jgi:hypothetical protein
LLATLPFALTVGACVDDNADSGMVVLKAVAPDEGCTFSADADRLLTSGHIDAAADRGYLIAPLIRNDLTTVTGEAKTPKTIFVTGAQVVVKFYDDDLFSADERAMMTADGLTRYLTPFSGSVDPNGGTVVLPFEAVPTDLLAKVGERLTDRDRFSTVLDAQIQIVGRRGGGDVESNLFRFPIEVCADCERFVIGDCATLSDTAVIRTGGACQPSQDGQVDCCIGPDPDDREVVCENNMLPPNAPEGSTCNNNVDDPRPLVCPANNGGL